MLNVVDCLDQRGFELSTRNDRGNDRAGDHDELEQAAHVTHVDDQTLVLQLMQAADVVGVEVHRHECLIATASRLRELPLMLDFEKGLDVTAGAVAHVLVELGQRVDVFGLVVAEIQSNCLLKARIERDEQSRLEV